MTKNNPLYGIAAGGLPGAQRALGIFREEIDRVMVLVGCCSVAELSPELLYFTDVMLRPSASGKAEFRLIDPAAKAVAEGQAA